MQRRRRSATAAVAALALAIAAVALSAAAGAKPGYFVLPGQRVVHFQLHGSHGYVISVGSFRNGDIVVGAENGDAAVFYSLHSKSAPEKRIHARLPGVGRISMRFHSRHRITEEALPVCKGGDTVIIKGYFTGTFRLRGERGYTKATATRVRGEEVIQPRLVCNGGRAGTGNGGEDGFRSTTLEAEHPTKAGRIGFFADRLEFPDDPGLDGSDFGASLSRMRRGMAIFASVFESGKLEQFMVEAGRHPRTASVDPGGPFKGTANFERASDGSFGWEGPLSIEFPNFGRVPLAGPGFDVRLCVQRSCEGDLTSGATASALAGRPWLRAAAPTPSPWPSPGFPR
jgi:hypothetical protein